MTTICIEFEGESLHLSREEAEGLAESLDEEGIDYTWIVLNPSPAPKRVAGEFSGSIFGMDEDGNRNRGD